MCEKCELDTIYHGHLFYHTLHGLTPLFARHGLQLNDVERLPIHGGSLRLWVGHGDGCSPALNDLMEQERRLGVDSEGWYGGFSERVASLRRALAGLLRAEKARGSRIAAYGAAAKRQTMVNPLHLPPSTLHYFSDPNPHHH